MYFYCSPLVGRWVAPEHPFLSPTREAKGAPPHPWKRRGAAAITRAWCLFELSMALKKGCRLHIALNRADRRQFAKRVAKDASTVREIIAALDARDAQISKVEDREYILPRIRALAAAGDGGGGGAATEPSAEDIGEAEEAGFRRVTALVSDALRKWLVEAAGEVLLDKDGTSVKDASTMARVLYEQGKLDEALALFREVLAMCREVLGERHPDTLASMNNTANVLKAKGELDEALALHRKALALRREVLGERHPDTLGSMNNTATVLKAKGELDEALALFREASGLTDEETCK